MPSGSTIDLSKIEGIGNIVTERNQFLAGTNAAIRDGNYAEAIQRVNDVSPGVLLAGEAEWFYSRILFAQQQLQEAERVAIAGLKKSPAHYGLYRVLGEVIGEAGEVQSARKCLQGSTLDGYVTDKYFANETAELKTADHEREALLSDVVYQEPAKPLPPIVRLSGAGERKEFSNSQLFPSAPSVFVVENGKVWFDGHNLCVYDCNDVLIDSCTMGNPLLIESIRHQLEPARVRGNLGVVVARSADNYFHWTTDVAPGFHLLDTMRAKHGEIDSYLVSHSNKSFQVDFMEMASVDAEQVITQGLSRGQYFSAEKLLVPVFRHRMGMGMGRWAVDYLRGIARQSAGSHAQTEKRRVYISRRDVKSRGVENEDQLVDFLRNYGFEDITLDGKTLAEQMQLFSQCEIIFAPHGAGLTNVLYCERDAQVVEFFADFVQPCFRSLAYLSGLQYGHFSTIDSVAEQGELEASKRKHVIQHQHYTVDLDNVAAILDQLGVSTERKMIA